MFDWERSHANKIPCSAERLSLLDPPMIIAVVDHNAFHIGTQ
jgi:hypothetical protein